MNKKTRTIIIACAVVAVLIVGMLLIWKFCSPTATKGTKTVEVLITHIDGTEKKVTLKTKAETLWDAMEEKKLVEGTDSAYGKWITAVDGETADESKGQYWMFTKDGEWVDTACDGTYIADGEHYEFYVLVY
jgi:hypothetical protein